MKIEKIIEALKEKGATVETCKMGSDRYFNDGFSVEAFTVSVDYSKADAIEKYMQNKKDCRLVYFRSIYPERIYRLYNASDYIALEEHEGRVKEATERFWGFLHDIKIAFNAEIA